MEEKLPNYQGKKLFLLPLLALGGILLGVSIQLIFSHIGIIFPNVAIFVVLEPFLIIVGSLIVIMQAYYLISGIWRHKAKYLKQNPQTAYQRAIIPGFFGISLIFSIAIRNLLPSVVLEPENSMTNILANSFLSFLIKKPLLLDILNYIQYGLALVILIFIILTLKRILNYFGIDYMALIYTYYPEEGEIKKSQIYDIVRHPSYSMVILFTFTGFILHLSLYSLLLVFIIRLFFHLHLTRFEEKELMEKFGENYIHYKNHTPALIPHLTDWPKFWKFSWGSN